jgi:hypothetical protein
MIVSGQSKAKGNGKVRAKKLVSAPRAGTQPDEGTDEVCTAKTPAQMTVALESKWTSTMGSLKDTDRGVVLWPGPMRGWAIECIGTTQNEQLYAHDKWGSAGRVSE